MSTTPVAPEEICLGLECPRGPGGPRTFGRLKDAGMLGLFALITHTLKMLCSFLDSTTLQ